MVGKQKVMQLQKSHTAATVTARELGLALRQLKSLLNDKTILESLHTLEKSEINHHLKVV